MKPLNQFLVCQIVTLRQMGYSFGKIQKSLNLASRQTAHSAYKRYLRTGCFAPKKSTGRPKKLTEKEERKFVSDVLKEPKKSIEQHRVSFNSFACSKSISRITARRVLKKYGVTGRFAAKKINLGKLSKSNRLKWCYQMRKNVRDNPGFWQNVVFTDETRIRLSSDGVVRVLRKKGTRFDEKNLRSVCKDKRSLMYWGAIRYDGRKMLIKCPNHLNSDGYIKILKKYAKKMHHQDIIFQQDNAPIHKSKKTKDFLQTVDWETLDWPAYSPDINPIENLWAIIKKRLGSQTVTWENLDQKVREIWDSIEPEIIQNLYDSMPNRIKKVIQCKGAVSKY